jgi:Ca2+-binding RTX toxin-like protein
MRTVRIAVLISMAAAALLVLPDAASARWKTLNGPLIQNTGTGFCICKDGMRVEIGRFRNDGIPWDALRVVVTTSNTSPQTGVIADEVVALKEIPQTTVDLGGGNTRTIDRDAVVTLKFSTKPAAGTSVTVWTQSEVGLVYGAPGEGTAQTYTVANAILTPDNSTTKCHGVPATITGTSAGEPINGTAGNDVIVGLGGADTINGNGGDDVICGGPGNDRITTGAGNDLVDGQGDGDTIDGGDGNDVLLGGRANDTITGGQGLDGIGGGAGNDVITGNDGTDELYGEGGNDTLDDGTGDSDIAVGGSGNDTIILAPGFDLLSGDLGTDTLQAPAGAAEGMTAYVGPTGLGHFPDGQACLGGNGECDNGLVDFDNPVLSFENLTGTPFNDTLAGSTSLVVNTTLNGLAGDDLLHGWLGNDKVLGGLGNDTLFGDAGNDTLNGGGGTDTLDGGTGTDACTQGETVSNCP